MARHREVTGPLAFKRGVIMETTFEEFRKKVLKILPEATFSQDDDGQVIIHTNMKHFIDENGEEQVIFF